MLVKKLFLIVSIRSALFKSYIVIDTTKACCIATGGFKVKPTTVEVIN